MRTFVSSLLLLSILAESGGSLVRAAGTPPIPQQGRVLILKNEYTIEGDIELIDGRYRVRRKVGEAWVPAERVLVLVASLPDAYVFLRGRINLDDPDERLRLARWCRVNGLQQQALTELQVAAKLRPEHAETRRLLQSWTLAKLSPTPAKAVVPAPAQPTAVDLSPVEVTSESLGLFATRVQPILMNTCASCHATGRGGKFQLRQVYEDSISNRQTVERNLASVLRQINLNQPEESRLLIKAVSDHAHIGQAPLRDRQSAPYRTLESWVKLTVANNPHLRAVLPASAAGPSLPPTPVPVFEEQRPKDQGPSEWGAEARPSAPAVPAPLARGQQRNAVSPPTSSAARGAVAPQLPSESRSSSATNEPSDPYDPQPFNQKMHPEANKPDPGK